jgi:sec-independent protein translocase protein TatA
VFSQIGPLEIVLVIVVLLIVFGPKRLPSLGRSLGSGMREFKDSITGDDKHEDGAADAAGRPALSRAQADAPPVAPPAAHDVAAPAAQQGADPASEQRG